jgi:triosephosphate isomerase
VSNAIEKPLILGAQNVHYAPQGAFTGEISIEMLKEWGVQYVIVGHSERRRRCGETGEMFKRKVEVLLNADMYPILCIGESLHERKNNLVAHVLEHQLAEVLHRGDRPLYDHLVVAYEPIWAIGTGETATPEVAQETHELIRRWIQKNIGDSASEVVRIVYGGSVTADNAAALLHGPDIDGGLIGGASLDPETFNAIVACAASSTATFGQ